MTFTTAFVGGVYRARPLAISKSATEGELPVIKHITSIASLLIMLAVATAPLSAQERVGRNASGMRGAPPQSRSQARPASARVGSRLQNSVAPASTQMVVDEGEVIEGQPIEAGEIHEHVAYDYEPSTCDGNCGGCSSCSGDTCSTCRYDRRFCICLPSHGWVHAEYLVWFQNGMNLPPLVTTSPAGTARAAAGVLPNATVLYGGDDNALDGTRNGGRIRFGTWFDRCPNLGLEGEYFGLAQKSEGFFQNSTGTPILARPFFNIVAGAENSELVAFPGVLSGSVGVDLTSEFHGAAARLRRNLFCSSGCDYSPLICNSVPTSSRIDATVGYRYYELEESLDIRERLTSTDTANPGRFNILDHFDTRNQFNGGEIGVLWQGRRGLWSLDGLMRVGIGNTHQTVTIRGTTAITDANNTTTNFNNGILTQRTNIGSFDRDTFSMIPELGLTLGYQFTRRVRLTTGYSLIYWGNVARPGDQVDLDVNPNLFPPEANPFSGPLRPQFQFVSSDYWVHGVSFGADIRW